ncbi:MAG: DNA gyrase C-terminal beta-propeller domain-containing protein, partial [Oscillospiraceae bacterium]
ISIIRSSKDIPTSKNSLIERFGLSDLQATAIVQMKLGQLSGLEREKIEEELAEILEKVKHLQEILANESMILDIIKTELENIKKRFGDERKTEIQNVSGEMDIEDLIPEEDCVVTLTHFGYVKRQPVDVYKLQKRGGRGVSGMKQREEDFVSDLFISSSHDNVLFITNKGKMYKLKCYEIPEGSKVSQGMNIVNLLPLESDEKIAYMINVRDFDEDRFLITVTKKGLIKRTKLDAYKNVRKNGLIAVSLNEDDEIAEARLTEGNDNLLVCTKNGMCIRLDEQKLRPLSRSAKGVIAIRLRNDDQVIALSRIRSDASVMTVTTKGRGRRTSVDEYTLQNRGGFGKINYKVSDQKGLVAGVKVVDEDEDLILIADDGIIIRI